MRDYFAFGFFGIMFLLFFGGLIYLIFFPPAYSEGKLEKVPCYDEYERKVIGIECEELVGRYTKEDRTIGIVVYSFFTLLFSGGMILSAFVLGDYKVK